MLLLDRSRQHDDLAGVARHQCEPPLRRVHLGQRAQHAAQPPDFDAQARAMRFVGELQAECACDERVPGHVLRPRFAQRAGEREQHRAPGERDRRARMAHDVAAGIHDEGVRCQQCFDFFEPEESLPALRDQARGGRVQDQQGAFDLRRQRGDACMVRGTCGAGQRGARGLRLQAPQPDPCRHQFVDGPQRGRQGRGVEPGEHAFGRVEVPDQQEAPDFEIACVRGIHPVAVFFERRPRGVERLRGPTQLARGQRDLGFGDDASRARHGFLRTEGARRLSQQRLRPNQLAELCHRDASQREAGCVVAQGDPFQCAEGIARGECARRGGDQRVHGNELMSIAPHLSLPPPETRA